MNSFYFIPFVWWKRILFFLQELVSDRKLIHMILSIVKPKVFRFHLTYHVTIKR